MYATRVHINTVRHGEFLRINGVQKRITFDTGVACIQLFDKMEDDMPTFVHVPIEVDEKGFVLNARRVMV